MSQIDLIRAEIERLKEKYTNMMPSIQKCSVCDDLLSFLDTIKEQPVELEKEIERVLEDSSFRASIDSGGFTTTVLNYQKIARHFAQWGTEHLADERKMIEPEKKKGRTDCSPQGEVPNDSLATQSYEKIQKDELGSSEKPNNHFGHPVDFPTTDEEMKEFLATHPKVEVPERYKKPDWVFEQPVCESLEDAADAYVMSQDNFPADQREHLYAFNAFKAGWLACREQMMKEAVEGEIESFSNMDLFPEVSIPLNPAYFKPGDKVKLIIVKED